MEEDETDLLLARDKDQSEIRKELSQMSFENLQKLKEKLGTKIYNAAMFGVKKPNKFTQFKRENKNRPQEKSAKIQVSRFREVIPCKKKMLRDPRFDRLCGEFNPKAFKKSYSFLSQVRENDLEKLKKELETEEDPKQIKKIKYLIQRLENQIREEKKHKEKEDKKKDETKEIITAMKTGKKPSFKKKSEKRILDLVSQYEQLKNSGRLKKHIKRIRKKKLSKDKVQFENSDSE